LSPVSVGDYLYEVSFPDLLAVPRGHWIINICVQVTTLGIVVFLTTTPFAFISSRQPMNTVWRNSPSRFHSTKDISQTSFGFTHWIFLGFHPEFHLTRPRDVTQEESPAYGDGSARASWIRLACDNRTSAQPFSRFGIFPVFPEPGNGERAFVFHGDRERELASGGFSPFVESVRRFQAAAFSESLPEGRRFIDGLSSRVDGPVSDLRVLRPIRD
jgi:hypothetical protein